MTKLENAFKRLMSTHPFYAHLYLQCRVTVDAIKEVPTACITYRQGGFQMDFNSKFLDSLSEEQTAGVIEHELCHLVLDHLSEWSAEKKAGEPINKMQLYNIAMDCAINQLLGNPLPASAVRPENLLQDKSIKVLPMKDWKYYYNLLLQHAPKQSVPVDCHDGWGQGPGKEESKAAVQDMVSKARASAAGNVPKSIEAFVADLLSAGLIPWKMLLRNFVARATTSSTRYSRKKRHRRFGLQSPGKLRKRELVLGVCEDTSGSVPMEATALFRAEIDSIAKGVSKIYHIDADAAVHSVETVKKGKKASRTRKGAGGTAYQPAISKCLELGVDAIIYFGDMDSADKPTDPGIPVLWAVYGGSQPPGSFGSVVRVKG